jgi:hypothetical protein
VYNCTVMVDYPKSEPVLQSSYVFPKVESYGYWNVVTPSTGTVSEDSTANFSVA